jgi:hypothetical protein
MKLVMKYSVCDGYTFSEDVLYPIEYESAEALICDFEKALDEAHGNNKRKCGGYGFQFGTETFNTNDFIFDTGKILPEILTIDEWFVKENINP